MIRIIDGPLIVEPESWTLVFDRAAASWWAGLLAFGRHKHVRAYAYVPFLHVWLFYDVHLSGTNLIVAADGEPARQQIASWIANADLLRVRRQWNCNGIPWVPIAGWCVPAIRRLVGVPGGALRPSAFYAECLDHGGVPFEAANEFVHADRGAIA